MFIFKGFGIQDTNDAVNTSSDGDQGNQIEEVNCCRNCQQLNKELVTKRKQWTEYETVINATHENAMGALKSRLKDEQHKYAEKEKELQKAKKTIDTLQKEIKQIKETSCTEQAPVVAETLQRLIRGVL